MRILVTGSDGTLGRPLVNRLRRDGHEVWGLDLAHQGDPFSVRGDVREHRQLDRLFRKLPFDLVYHLAAEFGRANGEDYYEVLWATNAVGTKNVLTCQQEHGFKLVFLSSSEVYGDLPVELDEGVMGRQEVRQLNDYAISKWVNELQIMNAATQHATETVRVRMFNAYGPGEYFTPYRSVIARFAYSIVRGEPYTVHLGHDRSFLYVDDAVDALTAIAGNFVPGAVYNIGSTDLRSIRELSDLMLAIEGKDDSMVTYSEREPFTTVTKRIVVSRAERDLNLRPRVSLEEGLRRTLSWMRDAYR